MLDSVYKMLAEGGPWGLCTLLLAIILWLARDNIKQRDSNKQQLQVQYKDLLEFFEKKVESEVNNTSALKELRRAIEKLT